MNEPDSVDGLLARARAELSATIEDDARIRQALGLGPHGPGVSIDGTAGAESLGLRSWAALRASGKAGLLSGLVLVSAGFIAGQWSINVAGRDDERHGAASTTPTALERAAVELAVRDAPRAPARLATLEPGIGADTLAQDNGQPADLSREPAAASETVRRATGPRRRNPKQKVEDTAHPSARPGPATTEVLPDELALLRRAERALRGGDPAYALALLAESEQRFPQSRLLEERDAARVAAQCRLGEAGAALRASTFARAYPDSVYAERVAEACATSSARNTAPSEGMGGSGHE